MTAKETAALLRANDDFLIITHKNPDGDTLGSGYALWAALVELGKRARVVNSDEIPKKYSYLSASHDEKSSDFEPHFVVAVDIASPSLVGEPYRQLAANADVCIDHHGSNEFYAKNTLVDGKRASCCEVIAKVIDELPVKLDLYIATALYTGLATDTGCFRNRNTDSESHLFAARLIECGIDVGELNHLLFEVRSKSRIMLEQMVMSTLELTLSGRVGILTILQEMMQKSGAERSDVEGIASVPRTIEGVEVGVTMRELDNGNWKISLRTGSVDAAKICAVFGGGGHFGAAGFECSGEPAQIKALLVSVIEKALVE